MLRSLTGVTSIIVGTSPSATATAIPSRCPDRTSTRCTHFHWPTHSQVSSLLRAATLTPNQLSSADNWDSWQSLRPVRLSCTSYRGITFKHLLGSIASGLAEETDARWTRSLHRSHDACHHPNLGCSVVPPYRETGVDRWFVEDNEYSNFVLYHVDWFGSRDPKGSLDVFSLGCQIP